jgi:CO/xanthine dehydrogenase FAD-binding subunit
MPSYNPSTLFRPKTVPEALNILKERGPSARLVAGNTTIYELAAQGALVDIECLVDLTNLSLSYIKEEDTGIALGATTTFTEIAKSPLLEQGGYVALKETGGKITPPQVRNMGTIGGALCSGIPFYDMPTTVLAMGGRIRIASADGERKLDVDDFFLDYFMTALSPEEMLMEVLFARYPNSGSGFVKLGRISADFAVVNAAARVILDSAKTKIEQARIAVGAVANKPIRLESAERYLEGKAISRDHVLEASRKFSIEPTPSIHASSEYKKRVMPILVRDALLMAINRAGVSVD